MATVIVPARAGVLSAVGPAGGAASARPGAVVARHRSITAGSTTRCRALAAEAVDAAGCDGGASTPWSRRRVDCRYAGQSHELTVPTVDGLRGRARRRNGYDRPGTPVEVVALRARPVAPAPVDVGRPSAARARTSRSGRQSSPSPTARSGCPTAGGPSPGGAGALDVSGWLAEPGPDRWSSNAVTLDPAALQVLISRLTGHRRRDGRGAAARRVQPEHQGAGRLLGRAVHRRRRAARAGRAHPRAPRLDAGVGARRPSTRFGEHDGARATRSILNDPFAGGTHLNDITLVAPCFVATAAASSAGSPTARTMPTSAARRPGSMPADAVEIQQEGLRIPPVLLTDEVRAIVARQRRRTPDERARRPRRPGRRERRRRRAGCAALRRPRRSTRCSPTASAACAPRSAALPDGSWHVRGRARLARPGARAAAARRGSRSTLTDRRATRSRFDFTGTDPQRARQRQRRRGGDRQRRRVRPAHAPSIRRSRPTAARCGRCAVVAPAGHDGRRVAARRRRRRQRRGQPARRRRVPRRPGAGACPGASARPARGR